MSKFGVIALFAILVASIGISPTFAQQMLDAIEVSTDKSSYSDGETIVIFGKVREQISGTPVTLLIISPLNSIVTNAQIEVQEDDTFSIEVPIGGPMKTPGEYTVKVQHGTEQRTAETSFVFTGGTGGGEIPGTSGTSIAISGTDFMVNYQITGGKVLSITPDVDGASLIIAIETTGDGVLTITLPRDLMDATLPDGTDDTYFVLIDGQEEDFDDDFGETARTLTISFIDGSEEIEIIGTFVVPEFGTVAIMILAVAIVSIIAVSARSKLSILPKY